MAGYIWFFSDVSDFWKKNTNIWMSENKVLKQKDFLITEVFSQHMFHTKPVWSDEGIKASLKIHSHQVLLILSTKKIEIIFYWNQNELIASWMKSVDIKMIWLKVNILLRKMFWKLYSGHWAKTKFFTRKHNFFLSNILHPFRLTFPF